MKQWTIIYRPRYSAWFGKCGEELQDEILAHLEVLKIVGPNLGRPRVDHIKGSVHQNMKELRVQFKGDPVRVLFAFDPDQERPHCRPGVQPAFAGDADAEEKG
jgi:hypothetical protein